MSVSDQHLPSDEQARELEERYVHGRAARVQARRDAAPALDADQALHAEIQRDFLDFDRHDVLTKSYPPQDHVIICEGDSWFNHPFLRDIPECLDSVFGFSVLHSNRPGKLLSQSVDDAHFMAPYADSRRGQIKALLLSGGGNDLINWNRGGAAYSPIFRPAPGSHDPDAFINHAEVRTALGSMCGLLRRVAQLLHHAGAKTPVLLHCYDHIIPHVYGPSPFKGTWINPQLDAVGAPKGDIRGAITRDLQNQWIDAYKALCHELGWTFVDLGGCAVGGWHDEIHPRNAGFQIAADRFRHALEKLGVRPSRRIEQLAAA